MANHHGNFGELCEAVFAGVLVRAETALDTMQRENWHAEEIRRAQRRARPEENPQLTAPREPLPIPGHRVGSTMGIPRLEKKDAA